MNILFICDEYPPGKNGGIGTATQNLARGLARAGHGVVVVGLYEPGYGSADEENDHGVRVLRRRLQADRFFGNGYSLFDALAMKTLVSTGIFKKQVTRAVSELYELISKLIQQHAIDIIEWPDFCWYAPHLPGNFTRPLLPIPLVIKFHGSHSHLASRMNLALDPSAFIAEKLHLRRASAYSAVSRRTAEDYKKLYGIREEIKVLYNSVEVKPYPQIPREAQYVFFSGSFVRLKGINVLLEAWEKVHRTYPTATLNLYGKGKLPKLPSMINVINHGFVSASELETALRKSTLAVFPSLTECFAMAPLEAMANGCPVIYTRMGSASELVDDCVNGLLVEPGEAGVLANAICRLLANKPLRCQLAVEAAHTISTHFSVERSVQDHLVFYATTVRHFNPDSSLDGAGEKATSIPPFAYS